MPKDSQGVERGKCNTCDECEEYTSPKTGARCDYCNHTPVDHVRIIKLGTCRKCTECQEYESGSKNSYTDCQYCGCMAQDHVGAEKLRKKPPTLPAVAHSTAIQQRTLVMGGGPPSSLSSPSDLKCKNPGCSRPRCVEKGKIHDFCGRTCAGKYLAQASTGVPMGSNVTQSLMKQQYVSSCVTPPTQSSSLPGGRPSPPASAGGGGGKLCGKCGLKPSNPGYKWCQSCFTN